MVVLHVKIDTEDHFLLETTVTSAVNQALADVSNLYNLRMRLQALTTEASELMKFGVSKPLAQQDIDESVASLAIEEKPAHATRDGKVPSGELAADVNSALEEAKAYISVEKCAARKPITFAEAQVYFDKIKETVEKAFPEGLPAFEPVHGLLSNVALVSDLDPETSMGWWCSKSMDRSKLLSDVVGKNEKTKIILKMTKKGSATPVQEPTLDPVAQQNMVKYWHQKQEDEKKMAESALDDDHLSSEWANPNGLRSQLNGTNNISLKL
eukprot:TRINITY_DN25027_c0_g1_i1.p1 TRINITY_DN25027_c0_g1~~TRINITY_DN25027_c0_g1_i1.p1  ORF type:complete len:299 (-),score=56.12 TRINITY_DN25027_c0_g1_i1:113-916(-)